jgi:hypothetical protein
MLKRLAIFACLIPALAAAAQTVQPILQPHATYVDAAGDPCVGCFLYSYAAGTTTPLNTYTDSTGGTPNTNPVVLGTDGGAAVWLGASSYKFILKDTGLTPIWTVDNVSGVGKSLSLYVPLAGGTMTGLLTNTTGFAGTINGAVSATQFTGADIGAKVNAAIASLPSNCGEVIIPAGAYSFSTAIVKPRCVKLHGQSALGTVLTWTGTSGAAVVAADSTGDTQYPQGDLADLTLFNSHTYVATTATTVVNTTAMTVASGTGITNGMHVYGPYIQPGTTVASGGGTTSIVLSNVALATDATNTQNYAFSTASSIGIYFGGDPTGTISASGSYGDHQNVNRVRVWGFPTCLQWGNNAWSNDIDQSVIAVCRVGVAFPSWNSTPGAITNSGEAVSFTATSIQSSTLGLNLLGFSDFNFFSSRCDYNTQCGVVNAANFYGMHFEQSSNHILTVFGTSQPNVQIYGGVLFLSSGSGSDSDLIFVNTGASVVAVNPELRLSGPFIEANHTVTNVVNWAGTGGNAVLDISGLPNHAVIPITNATCNWGGCNIQDPSTGLIVINGVNYSVTQTGAIHALSLVTTQSGAGASVGNTGGNGSITGNATGLELVSTTNGSPNRFFVRDSEVNLGTGAVNAPGIEPLTGLTCMQIDNLGSVTNSGAQCPLVPVQITISSFTAAANSCYGNTGTLNTPSTTTMTGALLSMAPHASFSADPRTLVGWGSTGGMTLNLWISAGDTLKSEVCNTTGSPITTSAITFNVGAS